MEKTALVWIAVSAGLMIVGAIGPWATALGGVASVGGLDGGNDGWFVVIAGAIALLVLGAVAFGARERAVWALPVLALVGLAVAAIDRRDVLEARARSGPLGFGDIFAGR